MFLVTSFVEISHKSTIMDVAQFTNLIRRKRSAPFLFVGSGFSRHYLRCPDWMSLLAHFAVNPVNQYKTILNTDSLPKISSVIAKEYNEQFWQLPKDDQFRCQHEKDIVSQSSALKIRIADYLRTNYPADIPEQYKEEIELLKTVAIDGIITTNWDDFIEQIFPTFTVYIGQQELIFSQTYNIGEVFKIHGSISKPESMILTQEDYDNFNMRNPYLAAKLLTIFIEHPVIFIGYSISDSNVQELLESIVRTLSSEQIERLRDNLIFVEWVPEPVEDMVIEYQDLVLSTFTRARVVLPVLKIRAHNYRQIYECLGHFERGLPANLLREYKKQFYDIVVSEKPEKKICVLPESEIEKYPDIQVVYGFGAVQKYQTAIGYTGLKSINIFRDIVDDQKYDALQLMTKTIPELCKGGAFIPVYKYLRDLGIRGDVDYKNSTLGINTVLRKGKDFQAYQSFGKKEKSYSLREAISVYSDQVWKAVCLIPYLSIEQGDLEVLRSFIVGHFNDFLVKKHRYASHMRKLICFYDWKMFGWG